MNKILEVKDLRVVFKNDGKENTAVDGVSFDVERGEVLCIVGESGCGKSVTSLSIMQLVATPPGRYAGGQILFEGQNILGKNNKQMGKIRGKNISMIFQEPMTALNPIHKIGAQISEALRIHDNYEKKDAWKKAIEMLAMVGVPNPIPISFPAVCGSG